MLIECSLQKMKEFLESESITCQMKKKTQDNPYQYLVVSIGQDDKQRPELIELLTSRKIFSEEEQAKETTHNYLHLGYFFPFEFPEEAASEVARFLLFINRTLDFTGFGISEVDHVIFFRHDLYCARGTIDSDFLKGIMGYILLIIDSFGPIIESIAKQEETFEEAIKKWKVERNK